MSEKQTKLTVVKIAEEFKRRPFNLIDCEQGGSVSGRNEET